MYTKSSNARLLFICSHCVSPMCCCMAGIKKLYFSYSANLVMVFQLLLDDVVFKFLRSRTTLILSTFSTTDLYVL